MTGQAQANYIASNDQFVTGVNLAADTPAGYCVNTAGGFPAAGTAILGVTRAKGLAGDRVSVTTANTVPAISGAAIASEFLDLATDGNGKLIPATTGDQIVARSEGTASGADEYIRVRLNPEAIKA